MNIMKLKKKLIFKKLKNLNNEIESNRNDYETLVEKTTLEIENFIKRIDTDPKTQ